MKGEPGLIPGIAIMKVLVVNPWVGNIAEYTRGLCEGLSNICEVTLVTNCYDTNNTKKYKVIKSFFKKSEKQRRGAIRKVLRGFEYYQTYKKIIDLAKNNQYDIVHVQWFLMYSLDLRFIKKLKRYTRVVLTAHNVLPHVKGEKYLKNLDSIYQEVEMIFVHGERIKKEFIHYFPRYQNKLRIQNHGELMTKDTTFDISIISGDIQDKIKGAEKIFIFFGNIFYNKGTDILLKTWIDYFSHSEDLLVIAGRTTEKFDDFEALCLKAKEIENIEIFNTYVEDNLLNYLINKSNIVVLPYRHASMSGVVFTAAQFKKPIICTEAGSITEYVRDGEDCFICEPTEEDLKRTIEKIREKYSVSTLNDMGNKLYTHIDSNYSWYEISKRLVANYQELLNN